MSFPETKRSRIRRLPDRGFYDKDDVYRILDAGTVCHVGIAPDGKPVVIPTLYARVGDEIVLHGSTASRLLRYVREGGQVCVTVTHVDGVVLARSLFHHSINYRSAVVFGTGRVVEKEAEKIEALKAITDQLMAGRWEDARRPSPVELKATAVVAVLIEEASAKVRTGPPGDEQEDYELDVWAGVLPIRAAAGEPQPDPLMRPGIPIPDYVSTYGADRSSE